MSDGDDRPRPTVDVVEPEGQCLLALLMRDLIEANLRDEANAARLRALRGDVRVRAGEMVVTLRFGEGRVSILKGTRDRPRSEVRGTMAGLLGIARGGGLVGPVLTGAIAVGGNPFFLLKLLPLIRAPRPEESGSESGARQ